MRALQTSLLKSVVGTCLFVSLLWSGCDAGYVVRSAYFQAELLAHRVTIEEALANPELTTSERASLERIRGYRAYAKRRGLKTGETYTSVALHWPRELFNISACRDDSFEPVTWSFPIVGEVPYLGFFRRQDAFSYLRSLQDKPGIEIYARRVGAYSTLGFFDDPVLPGMLERHPISQMTVVFHELTHGTLWLPGSVRFNESFASFVGEQLSLEYLRETADPEAVRAEEIRRQDRRKFENVIRSVVSDLEKLYASGKPRSVILREKKRLIREIPERLTRSQLLNPAPYERLLSRGEWNNARLIQFRAYHDLKPAFKRLYLKHGRSISRMLEALEKVENEEEFIRLSAP